MEGNGETKYGIGGLGHMAVQYAKAMGMRCVAIDVADDKLALAKSLDRFPIMLKHDREKYRSKIKHLSGSFTIRLIQPDRTPLSARMKSSTPPGKTRPHGSRRRSAVCMARWSPRCQIRLSSRRSAC
jgi:D-arabinose 1-dehydrogenase-like Zn-dependent alcohol dehydrogenase